MRIDSAWKTFRTDCPFAGIPWLEGPEKGSTLPRTSHVHRTQRDSKSSCFLPHRREATFVGICSLGQYDRVARLAMEYGIGLSAACQEQYHDEYKTSCHTRCPSLAGLLPEMCPLLHAGPRCHRERALIFDETTQADLVFTGHLNKFDTKPPPLTPTDFG